MNNLNDNQGRTQKQVEDSYKILAFTSLAFLGTVVVLIIDSLVR